MMPIVYFAGVNTSNLCEAFNGHHVLESFADVRQLMDRYRPLFKSMALDSGAFSQLTTGVEIDIGEYVEFCHQHGAFYDFIASLDSINGGVDVNVSNWREMRDRGVHAVPTFHQGEPWSLLADYCAESKALGLGFQRPIKRAREWLTECFERIPSDTLVHGWAMTNYTDLPFHSVDSRTWLFEMRALLSVEGQGAATISCLTPSELLGLVVKRYQRLAKREKWSGVETAKQMSLEMP